MHATNSSLGVSNGHGKRRLIGDRLTSLTILALAVSLGFIEVSRADEPMIFDQDPWSATCQIDPMTDKKTCVIELNFSQKTGSMVFGKLSVYTDGDVFMTAAPQAAICSLRIDKEPALNVAARPFCIFDEQSAKKIVSALKKAKRVLISVVGPSAVMKPTEYSAEAYSQALAATQKWLAEH